MVPGLVEVVSVVEGAGWLGFVDEAVGGIFGRARLVGLELGSMEGPAVAC